MDHPERYGHWDRWQICDLPHERDALRAQLAESHAEIAEQARLLSMSAEREARLLAKIVECERERDALRAALLSCARQAKALKRECGMDPESPQAIRNAQYQNISTTAHIALGTIRGPSAALEDK